MEEKSIIVSRSIEIDKLEKYILGKKSVELEIEFGIPRSQLCRLWRVYIRDPTFTLSCYSHCHDMMMNISVQNRFVAHDLPSSVLPSENQIGLHNLLSEL